VKECCAAELDATRDRLKGVHKFAAGTIFADRYEILASVGAGGMGHVYRARHIGLDKIVALKLLEVDRLRDASGVAARPGKAGPCDRTGDAEARFGREARALARLDHPGCVRVLDTGRWKHVSYLVLELIPGETLGAAIKHERFEIARAIDVARQLLLALSHAHGLGVIHRDVKPENIILRDGKRPVLIDFGLASLSDEAALTAKGMCVGSPSYLAPERLLGRPHDARTDVYAIGVILYEMIAGTKPFAGDNPQHTMTLALNRPPRPLRAVRRGISPELDRIITRALAKDPARRFADADEMLLALNDLEHNAELAAQRAADDAETESASTQMFGQLAVSEPSWLARAWAWLRYGGWRWRRKQQGPDLSTGPFHSFG
jgi:serine/threonine protein kinase